MDKVVDHLLVFRGDGDVKDFPGHYTQYREWSKLESKTEAEAKERQTAVQKEKKNYHNDTRRRLSYKEKMELQQLERDIETLTQEQHALEEALCSGKLSVDELTEKSRRLPQLKDELDEKEMRWLELSELG